MTTTQVFSLQIIAALATTPAQRRAIGKIPGIAFVTVHQAQVLLADLKRESDTLESTIEGISPFVRTSKRHAVKRLWEDAFPGHCRDFVRERVDEIAQRIQRFSELSLDLNIVYHHTLKVQSMMDQIGRSLFLERITNEDEVLHAWKIRRPTMAQLSAIMDNLTFRDHRVSARTLVIMWSRLCADSTGKVWLWNRVFGATVALDEVVSDAHLRDLEATPREILEAVCTQPSYSFGLLQHALYWLAVPVFGYRGILTCSACRERVRRTRKGNTWVERLLMHMLCHSPRTL